MNDVVLSRDAMGRDRFLAVTEYGSHGDWTFDHYTGCHNLVYDVPYGRIIMGYRIPEATWENFVRAEMSASAEAALSGESSITEARRLANLGEWTFYLENMDVVEEEMDYGYGYSQ